MEPILGKVYKDTFLSLSASEEPPEIAVGDAWFDTCGLMPNVFVEGFGLIGLPLSDREAKYLAEVSPAFLHQDLNTTRVVFYFLALLCGAAGGREGALRQGPVHHGR
jgi:hypothetical protein